MRILIKENAAEIYHGTDMGNGEHSHNYYRMLKAIQGTYVEVETEYLFRDQFNTVPIPGVSELGMRIMWKYVDEIAEDARIGVMKCNHCGKQNYVELTCPDCKNEQVQPLCRESEILLDYLKRAKAEREAGGKCEVSLYDLCYIAVTMSSGEEYFFQGEEADNLMGEYEDVPWLEHIDIEDYLLAIAQNW